MEGLLVGLVVYFGTALSVVVSRRREGEASERLTASAAGDLP